MVFTCVQAPCSAERQIYVIWTKCGVLVQNAGSKTDAWLTSAAAQVKHSWPYPASSQCPCPCSVLQNFERLSFTIL